MYQSQYIIINFCLYWNLIWKLCLLVNFGWNNSWIKYFGLTIQCHWTEYVFIIVSIELTRWDPCFSSYSFIYIYIYIYKCMYVCMYIGQNGNLPLSPKRCSKMQIFWNSIWWNRVMWEILHGTRVPCFFFFFFFF